MDHFLHDIEITNFKSIRHQKIEGCKRVNVFIGYPNVGKSNILEAIGSIGLLEFIGTRVDFQITDLIRVEDANHIFFNGDSISPSEVSIDNRIKCAFDFESGSLRLCFAYRKNESESGEEVDIAGTTFPLFINNDLSIDEEFLKRKLIAWRDQIKEGRLLGGFPSVKKYDFSTSHFFKKGFQRTLLFPSGENLGSVIATLPDLRKNVSDLLAAYDLRLLIDQSSGSLRAFKNLSDDVVFSLPFSMIADTLQRLIFHKAAIASNKNTVLLFEEPEAHMFPPYISKFTADIISDENNNQYFINTHSPFVLNDFLEEPGLDLSIYVVGLKNGETKIRRLADAEVNEIYQHGIDLFFNLETYLEA